MIERLGIIPAAGKACRFGGVLKELLPLKEGVAMIDRAHDALVEGGCEDVLIITSVAKIAAIAERLPECTYRIQQGGKDVWGAIVESFALAGKLNCYAMPDTLFDDDAFCGDFGADFTLGLFKTDHPERFGMLRGGQIIDKQPGEPGQAWGVLIWSDRVVELWMQHPEITSHTQAFNMAMKEFGFKTFNLCHYYDAADMPSYREILSHV